MFSVMSVCHAVHGGFHVTITHDALDLTIQGPPSPSPAGHGASLYMEPPAPAPTPRDMFKLVHFETCAIGKQTVSFLIEYFVVMFCGRNIPFTYIFS